MALPIFANRRDKGHHYLKRFETEAFKIVSDVCDLFSKKKLKAYFNKPVLAFLFVWFSKSKDGKAFAIDKFRSQNKTMKGYTAEMIKGINSYGS